MSYALLLELVKEKGIVDIILSMKKDMESYYCTECDKQCTFKQGDYCRSCENKWFCWNHLSYHEIEGCTYD